MRESTKVVRSASRGVILIALVTGAGIVGPGTTADATRSTAGCSWRVVLAAKMPPNIAGVAALPSGDVWAWGRSLMVTTLSTRTLQ